MPTDASPPALLVAPLFRACIYFNVAWSSSRPRAQTAIVINFPQLSAALLAAKSTAALYAGGSRTWKAGEWAWVAWRASIMGVWGLHPAETRARAPSQGVRVLAFLKLDGSFLAIMCKIFAFIFRRVHMLRQRRMWPCCPQHMTEGRGRG